MTPRPTTRRPTQPQFGWRPLAARQRLELTRAQEQEQLADRALDPHGGDAALLEIDPAAREVEDDLRERGVVPHDQHALLVAVGVQQSERVVAVEAVGERGVLHGLDVQRAAGQLSRVASADLRARVASRELDTEPGEAFAGRDGLALPARGQLALGVGLGVVRDGLSVAEKPELRRHRTVTISTPPGSSQRQYASAR